MTTSHTPRPALLALCFTCLLLGLFADPPDAGAAGDWGVGARAVLLQDFGTIKSEGYDKRELMYGVGASLRFGSFFSADLSYHRSDAGGGATLVTSHIRAHFAFVTAALGPTFISDVSGKTASAWNARAGIFTTIGPVEVTVEGLYLFDNLSTARREFNADEDLLFTATATVFF